MTSLQQKCIVFSAGLHCLLLVILIGTSGFRDKPTAKEMPVITMISSRILDQAGTGGGSPAPVTAAPAAPPQQAAPVQPQAVAPVPPHVEPQHVDTKRPEPIERPKPREVTPEPAHERSITKESESAPVHHHHEIVPTFDPVKPSTSKSKSKTSETTSSTSTSSSSRSNDRLRRDIAASLGHLATGVKSSGAGATVVEEPGQGGGEAFTGYETVVFNYYNAAWIRPDSMSDPLVVAEVKIVVARDGSIVSAEIIRKSGERTMDRSVERVFQKVEKLPPFPAGAHDEQRTFLINFKLDSKEGTG